MPATLPTNNYLAWAVVIASILIAAAPLVGWHVKRGAASRAAVVTAPMDAPDSLLSSLIAGLEQRAQAAEKRVSDCYGQIVELKEALAVARNQIDHLTARVELLTDRATHHDER